MTVQEDGTRTSEDKLKAHAAFEGYLVHLGLRQTKQRKAVLDAVLMLGPHVDAETIAAQARKIDPTLGLATVYRTLQLMTDAGLIVERQFGRDRAQFEFAQDEHDHHDHLICTTCGAIIEFFDDEIEKLQVEIAKKLGFELKTHRMELYAECSNKRTCERMTRSATSLE